MHAHFSLQLSTVIGFAPFVASTVVTSECQLPHDCSNPKCGSQERALANQVASDSRGLPRPKRAGPQACCVYRYPAMFRSCACTRTCVIAALRNSFRIRNITPRFAEHAPITLEPATATGIATATWPLAPALTLCSSA